MNAPGASTNTSIKSPGISFIPKIAPLPKSSLMPPKRVRAKAKPSPIPSPSIIEEMALFFDANASARPNTIQLTTINGINNPKHQTVPANMLA